MAGNEGGANELKNHELQNHERGYAGIWSTHYRAPIQVAYGLRGDSSMINIARYVAVAPRNVSTGVRHLPFATWDWSN